MAKELRREFIIEGLDCGSCAMKIEDGVNKIDGVSFASVNFATKTLVIEGESAAGMSDILSRARDVIKRVEPHATVMEKVAFRSKKAARSHEDAGGHHHDHNHEIDHSGSHDHEAGYDNGHDHGHSHDHGEGPGKVRLILIGIGAVLFFAAILLKLPFQIEFPLYLAAYLLIGGDVVLQAARNIIRGQVFDENFLMSIATIGAFAIQEFPEGVAVMLFYQIGEFFQGIAVNRSRKSISELMDIRPDFANLKVGDSLEKVDPDEVSVGAVIVVKPGEKVPLDGRVIEGRSMLDTSALTGESVPRDVEAGGQVLSGAINQNGLLTIEVEKEFGESTVSKILDLVENASSRKAPTEKFITKFARYYTPVVVFVALALAVLPPLVVQGATFGEWIYRALVFLVVSCPCALVISIPLGFFGGIGGASRNGILIKGSNYLEALNNVDTVVFDKTGTLTKGVFKVTKVISNGRFSEAELLKYAAYAESYSNHPIALSVQKAYGEEIDRGLISEYDEISGHGIKVKAEGKAVLAGNSRLMQREGVSYEETQTIGTVIYLAVDSEYAGCIIISDEVKDDSSKAIQELRAAGVRRIVMLTGDSRVVGEQIGRELGLDEVYAELLPDQKVEKLEMLEQNKTTKGRLVFVGDGINDAPVLARADVGVAMGGVGSDAAIEAADVVLMNDEPSKLARALNIAGKTRTIVWQNIIFAMVVKGVVLLLGAGGIATMWEAVFADVGVALLAILNAMRIMPKRGGGL